MRKSQQGRPLMRSALTWFSLTVLLGLLSLAGGSQAGSGPGPQSAGTGALTGRVTRWPASPVEGPGIEPSVAPAPGVKLLIYGPERQEVASVLTDEAGQYRLDLPPGTYLIELAPGQGRRFTKDLPAAVTITRGRETRLNIRLDTGLR